MSRLEILAVDGLPEVRAGDRLSELIARAAGSVLADGDVLVVTQKVVSKAEGRVVACPDGAGRARRALIESEAVRVLRRRGELVIAQTRHGFVCASAGVDVSNVPAGCAALLPLDADRSARRIRDGLLAITGRRVGVVVSDTFGRPWRRGVTDVAIGSAGVAALLDLRGTADALGRPLHVTQVAVADELAGAAELVMGKAANTAVAIVRGVERGWLRESSVAAELVRSPREDLFR